jgi:hypothetical protein
MTKNLVIWFIDAVSFVQSWHINYKKHELLCRHIDFIICGCMSVLVNRNNNAKRIFIESELVCNGNVMLYNRLLQTTNNYIWMWLATVACMILYYILYIADLKVSLSID